MTPPVDRTLWQATASSVTKIGSTAPQYPLAALLGLSLIGLIELQAP
jgi:hypothetical protein